MSKFLTCDQLFEAIKSGDVAQVRSLLEAQTQTVWDTDSVHQRCALHYVGQCAREGLGQNHLEVAKVLLEFGAKVTQLDGEFQSPLMVALSQDSPSACSAPVGLSQDWSDLVTLLIEKDRKSVV